MVKAIWVVVGLSSLSVMVGFGAGCSGGAKIVKAPPKQEAAAAAPDAFQDFRGDRVDVGVEFTLNEAGTAVKGPGVVVSLSKVKTTSWTPPGGEEEEEGTAFIIVRRGGEEARVRIKEAFRGTAQGVEIEVLSATVAYDEARARWLPTAQVIVRLSP